MRRISLLLVVAFLVWTLPASASRSTRTISSTVVSEEGSLGRVEVRKTLAAVLQRDEGIVALVDVKNPRLPKVLGRYDDGAAQSLDGDLAFSKDGRFVIYARQTVQFSRDGIHVIDVSDPKNPVLSSYSPGGGAYRVLFHTDASGEYVVLLDAVLGLVVYRFVEGVLIPVHVDALPALKVGGPASAGMEIVGDRLYVTTGETGLQIYDFANPVAPELLGAWGEEGLAEVEVVRKGKKVTAYAATEYWFDATNVNHVIELDVTDPAKIRELGRWELGGTTTPPERRVQGLEWAEGVLYAARSAAGLTLLTNYACIPEDPCGPTDYEQAHAVDVDRLSGDLVVSDASGRLLILAW
jgi:hypothetical protein